MDEDEPCLCLYALLSRKLVWRSADGGEWDEYNYVCQSVSPVMIQDIPEGHVVRRIYVRDAAINEPLRVVVTQETTLSPDVYRTAFWKTRIVRRGPSHFDIFPCDVSERSAELVLKHAVGECSIEDIEQAK